MSSSQQYFLADTVTNVENGLGFGKGSTDGVINRYAHRGFARPQLADNPSMDIKSRNNLNMRAHASAYSCHFDPGRPCGNIKNIKKKTHYCIQEKGKNKTNFKSPILLFIILIGALVVARRLN